MIEPLAILQVTAYQFLQMGWTSSWRRNGMIRIIANPYLTKEDVDAIEFGYKAKEDVIVESLLRPFQLNQQTIEQDAFNTLAWLIYKDKLQIKIAFTKNNSLYHEKFGIFYDELGNKIAFSGSANETLGGIRDNFEKIDVFCKEYDQERIEDMVNDFENLWNLLDKRFFCNRNS